MTIPIHDGSNESLERNNLGSEKSSWTSQAAKLSAETITKVREQSYNKEQAKNI